MKLKVPDTVPCGEYLFSQQILLKLASFSEIESFREARGVSLLKMAYKFVCSIRLARA